jgi:hypothetical protein
LDAKNLIPDAYFFDPTQPGGTVVSAATIYYPAPPYQWLAMASSQNPGGTCSSFGPVKEFVGMVATTRLRVVPPLSAQ